MPEFDSDYHRLRVDDTNGVRHLKFERNQQSSMRLDDPFATDIEYVAFLHTALAVCPHATRALVIGLGGGTFVKQLWRDQPHVRIDAVELDAEVVEVCRAYFALPDDERINVTVADGRDFVDMCSATYDIIVIDAFDDDRVPPRLLTEEFMRACRDILRPDGVIAYNVIGAVYGPHSKPFRSLYRTAANVWRHVWTFPLGLAEQPSEATRNIVMLATDVLLSTDELADRIVDMAGAITSVPAFELIAEELYRAPIRTGDVPLLVDDPHRRRR